MSDKWEFWSVVALGGFLMVCNAGSFVWRVYDWWKRPKRDAKGRFTR